MARRDRERRKGRRQPFRDPKPLILVVCEGLNTEPQYLRGFKKAFRNPRVEIEISEEHGVPKTLVEIAKAKKDDARKMADRMGDDDLAYDSVWCVFDIDDHPYVPEAKQMAQANGIQLAISNPSFELWLLLHFRANPGAQHRDEMVKMLKGFVTDYDKTVKFTDYASGYPQAVLRAQALDKLAESIADPGCNPTTGVSALTELIAHR